MTPVQGACFGFAIACGCLSLIVLCCALVGAIDPLTKAPLRPLWLTVLGLALAAALLLAAAR